MENENQIIVEWNELLLLLLDTAKIRIHDIQLWKIERKFFNC